MTEEIKTKEQKFDEMYTMMNDISSFIREMKEVIEIDEKDKKKPKPDFFDELWK